MSTCQACGRAWEVLPAHVIRTVREGGVTREIVQCPNCGHVQGSLKPEGEENGD